MKNITVCLSLVVLLAACSNNTKKIIVYSRGNAVIDKDAATITVNEGGSGHEEQTIEYNTPDKISLHIKSPAGETTASIPEKGYYILNAKNDTIIGSYQPYTAPKSQANVLSQETIKQKIDSLQLLMQGKNVSAAKRNYFILPNQAVKITNNTDAFIVGPYHQMTSIAKEGGKEPEVYRFYSLKEIRELIAKLQGLPQ